MNHSTATKLHVGEWDTKVVNTASSWFEVDSYLHSQGPVSISEKTSYYRISQNLEAVRFLFRIASRSEIWQPHRHHCCRCACQISKRCDNLNYQSRGFETSRDLTIRRLSDIETGSRTPNDAKIAFSHNVKRHNIYLQDRAPKTWIKPYSGNVDK